MRFRRKLKPNLLALKRSRLRSVRNQIQWLEKKQLESAQDGNKWQVEQDEKQIRRLRAELQRSK